MWVFSFTLFTSLTFLCYIGAKNGCLPLRPIIFENSIFFMSVSVLETDILAHSNAHCSKVSTGFDKRHMLMSQTIPEKTSRY